MNEADEILLGAIEALAYQNKLEIKLIFAYCDTNLEEADEKQIILSSLDRMEENMTKIKGTIDKIRSGEWV